MDDLRSTDHVSARSHSDDQRQRFLVRDPSYVGVAPENGQSAERNLFGTRPVGTAEDVRKQPADLEEIDEHRSVPTTADQ
jgi:hypothetical protein